MDNDDILFAARFGEESELNDYIDHFGFYNVLNARDERNNSILHMLCANGHLELLRKLLPDDKERLKSINKEKVIEKLLLNVNESKSTALHWAALNGKKEVCLYLCSLARLLQQGEEGDDNIEHKLTFAENNIGLTPASEAERSGHEDTVVELLGHMDKLDNGTQRQTNANENDDKGENDNDEELKIQVGDVNEVTNKVDEINL